MKHEFIHLRTQSSYSFLESALTIDNIIEIAAKQKMPAVVLSDRANLFGLLEFSLNASKKGLQPIHGVILNILYEGEYSEILLIAKDEIGYQNLLKVTSLSFTKNNRSICDHITLKDLITYNDGLIALSCYIDGIIGKNLLAKKTDLAISAAQNMQKAFGDRFYFEIMRHDVPQEKLIEADYLKIANDLDIPLVATNKVLFRDINMHDAHDVLLCISSGVVKEYLDRKRVSTNCYFKSPKEMIELFKDLPEAIENTINLAQRCYIMAHANPPMLPNFSRENISETELIRREAESGLLAKLAVKFKSENIPDKEQEQIRQKYFDRLNYELDVICKMDFSGYFLIVSDFIKWSKEQGILVGPGRGSGAGSIVAWCLLITDLDPIKFGLLFERFLNPERISMPDFDIDFCQERREEVINYVRTKYGDNKVGQIITFGKMQAKAVIKDVSRVLELPYKYANYLTDLVPFSAVHAVTLSQAIKEVPELSSAAKGKGVHNLEGKEDLMKQVLDTSLILEGLHRHSSTHAAGIVIAGKDLVELVPVCTDSNSDMLIVQYSMKYCEIAGLVKFDFLGLQTLTVITKCTELLQEQGINIDFTDMRFDDAKTYQMLCKGKGVGVFQFESIGMKDTLRRLQPDSIQDLIALGALYRPGPMENIPTYIACKHGLQKPDYLHESLKPLLEETHGVVIYQEQVLEIAKILAGYTLGGADLLRKAMGKKIKKEMEEQEEIFIKGAVANNIQAAQAKSIFATLAKFAGYGFNKAHASAYGVISYQTAYLKANFPTEFLVACLNLEINNQDKIGIFINEAKTNNINIIPPNINISNGYFTIKTHQNGQKDIIYALGAIKGASVNFGKILMEAKNNKPFTSITDFIERMPLKSINSKLLENLIKAGCFDELHPNRDQLLLSASKLLAYSVSYHQEQGSNQFSLINVKSSTPNLLLEAEVPENSKLAFYEFEVLGLFMTTHPLSEYQEIFSKINVLASNAIHDLPNGFTQVKLAGVIQKKDSRMSARGRFVILQLSDPAGNFELSIFSEEILRDYVHLLNVENSVIIKCDLLKDDGGIKLTPKSFHAINEEINEHKFALELYPNNHAELKQIVTILKSSPTENGNTKITLFLKAEKNFTAKIELPELFSLKSENFEDLRKFN